jgi:dTDP-4-dehydrorhamnose reductase
MKQATNNLEIWGGLECTINRVNEKYFDQLEYSGHYQRDSDITKIAALGIKKIRYPILWEKHQQSADVEIDWRFTEKSIFALRDNGIDIIAGLVHHGSGPAFVNMTDESFATGLAAYAGNVAEAFPWVNYYTPVNEPLTTARFCGLYGVWYPHKHDNNSFCRILINECKATVLAMEAIRKINPDAKLVQTDDLGKIHSTPLLQYQADFENNRRWLSFDLLCGKVDEHHPLWGYLLWSGIAESELRFFLANICPPAILGINHYLTSERYIDENIQSFPPHTHGGNFEHRYADVEAVRVGHVQPAGPYNLLTEAWERYGLPISVTEVHLFCTREEQMRWLHSVWDAACKLKQDGVDIRAITPWAMLGSYGWNRLLTQPNGQYEAGIFDLSSGQPRPTALAGMIKAYAEGKAYQHPIINQNGWWQRSARVIYGSEHHFTNDQGGTANPLLIIGKSGKLGMAFSNICHQRGINYLVFGREGADITDLDQIEKLITDVQPWAIVNTAGFTDIDAAEHDSASCFTINTTGAENLAVLCEKYGIKLLTYSTGLVFNGLKNHPYTELDKKSPLNVYGQSKAMAEQSVLKLNPSALVVRSAAFFSPWDKNNFIKLAVSSLQEGRNFYAAHDVFVSPTYVPDLVNVSLDLLLDDEKGIWHLSNDGKISWAELAFTVAERCGFNTALVKPKPLTHFRYKAKRPLYNVLSSNRGSILPGLDSAINHFIKHNL